MFEKCSFCGKIFKEKRYLETHLKKGKECRKLRGILFVCLRCNCFHTTKLGLLEVHLQDCHVDGRVVDVLENYQNQVVDLRAKVRHLEETLNSFQNPKKEKKEDESNFLDMTFGKGERDINFSHEYEEIVKAKKYTTILKKIKHKRRLFFKDGNLKIYKTLLKEHLNCLRAALKNKKFSERKINKTIRAHFTALDLRLLRFGDYETMPADGSLFQELNLVLSCREKPAIFSFDTVALENFGSCIFPIRTILEMFFVRDNPTYVYFGKKVNDPFSFYYLAEVGDKRKTWKMDCRAQDLTVTIFWFDFLFDSSFQEKLSSYF